MDNFFLVDIEESAKVDGMIKNVQHEELIQRQKDPINDNQGLKYQYYIQPGANPKAVAYVLFGNEKFKEAYEKERDTGDWHKPEKKECPLCKAQI